MAAIQADIRTQYHRNTNPLPHLLTGDVRRLGVTNTVAVFRDHAEMTEFTPSRNSLL